jgi:uncharacterized membrane protein
MAKVVIRFIVGLLLPIYLGATLVSAVGIVSGSKGDFQVLELPLVFMGGLLLFPFALIFVGVQSFVYSFLMGFVVNPFVKSHVVAILVSVLLGTLSGWIIETGLMAGIGAVVGLMAGIFLRSIYSFESNPDG